jgi:hypothetical protein
MLTALFSNCSRTRQEEPTLKAYTVQVRVTGYNMLGGSAISNFTYDYAGAQGGTC